MSAVGDFLTAHLHYTVNQRLFEDTCRQLRDYKGDDEGREKLIEETLRLATAVSDLTDSVENSLPAALAYIKKHGSPDPDMADALQLIANNVKEDRARAAAYAMFVTSKKYGGPARAARKPMVANPFVFIDDSEEDLYPSEWNEDDGTTKEPWEDDDEDSDGDDSETISEESDDSEDGEVSEDEESDEEESGDEPTEDAEGDDSEDSEDDGSEDDSDEEESEDDESIDPESYEGYDDLGYSEDGEPQD